MNKYKITSILIACLILVSGLANNARAAHFAAIDMNLQYIGAGLDGCSGTTEYKYRFTITIYRACEIGSPALDHDSVTINYESLNGGAATAQKTFSAYAEVRDTLDELCPIYSDSNGCRYIPAWTVPPENHDEKYYVDNYPGFTRIIYSTDIVLPSAQTDWRFWWYNSARNSGILNLLTDPASTSAAGYIYVEMGINNVTKYNNSSPKFNSYALQYICMNQPAKYINDPSDANNDSLDITQAMPQQTAPPFTSGFPYVFAPGFTEVNPIRSDPSSPYTINPTTGTTTFIPTIKGKFCLAFRCDEYERGTGVRLGYILRDVQLAVFECQTPPPALDPVPSSANTVNATIVETAKQGKAVFVCPGSNMNFTLTSNTNNPAAKIYMTMGTDPAKFAGSTFTVAGDGSPNPAATFSWTPTLADLGDHTLIINSKDSTCAGNGFALKLPNSSTILIKVVLGLDAGPDMPICALNPTDKQITVKGADDLRLKWTDSVTGGPATGLNADNIYNPVANVSETRHYRVFTMDLAPNTTCIAEDYITLYNDTTNTIEALPDAPVLCRPEYMQLEAKVTGKGPIDNLPCGPITLPPDAIRDSASIYGSVNFGRLLYDTLGTVTPYMPYSVRTAKQQFLIRRDELMDARMASSIIRGLSFLTSNYGRPRVSTDPLDPATYPYLYKNFRIALKCTDAKELSKATGFDYGLTTVYKNTDPNGIEFTDGWHLFEFDSYYSWDTNKNLLVEICYSFNDSVVGCGAPILAPPRMNYSPTTYTSALSLSGANDAVQDVCGNLTDSRIEPKRARPVFGVIYSDGPSVPFQLKWSPSVYLTDSTSSQPLAYVPRSIKYYVESMGKSGCKLLDSVDIYVPEHDYKIGPDSTVCLGDKALLEVNGGFVFKWHEYKEGQYVEPTSLACTNCRSTYANPTVTTHYKVEVGDSVFCYDTIDVVLKVLPRPDVRILKNGDTTITYGQSIQLLAAGARKYNWSPPAALNNANISNPVATPSEPTTYIVAGIGNNGCRATDSIRVGVNYRENLFIPSGFSPNGDGNNDKFRVANLTFRRIIEFRVFDRYGHEVYTGYDNTGWDGTYNDEPQPVGSYVYTIKIGYPDGKVENRKGDVSIVR